MCLGHEKEGAILHPAFWMSSNLWICLLTASDAMVPFLSGLLHCHCGHHILHA